MKSFIGITFALALLAGAFVGCSTPTTRIQKNLVAFNALPPAQQELIKKGEIAVGFTPTAVELALGEPDHVRIRTDASGTSEVWIYTEWEDGDGGILYTGFYHRCFRYEYPYYLYAPYRRERDRMRVTFKDDKVIAIDKEKT